MKKWLLLVLVLVSINELTAQVTGVSAEKLMSINPLSIAKRTVEFEPLVGYLWSSKTFNASGELKPLKADGDSTLVLQGLGFRFTYGFAKNFEAGGVVTTELNTFSLGLKYSMFQHDRFQGAALIGTTFANESDFVFRNSGFFGKTASFAIGFAFANKLGEKFSVDYDIQYQNIFNDSKSFADDFFANIDFGFHFRGPHIVVAGLSYKYNHFKIDQADAYLLTLNAGLVVQTGNRFLLVFNFPVDLIGRNADRFTGFGFALTITID